jgi:eukaryotic-like serine/threonine-protein kinase
MVTGLMTDNTIMRIQNTRLLYLLMVMPVLLLLSSIITQIASAQTNDGIFLTYQSHTYGFKIQYPSNWEKLEFAQGIDEEHRNIVVNFLSPTGEGTSNTFREYLIIEVGNLTSHDESLAQYTATQINLRQALPNFNLVESTLTSVSGGNPAHKIVYTYSNPIVGITKAMDILTIKSDKLYFLSYNADSIKYSKYLPIIQKVIDSFQIIK